MTKITYFNEYMIRVIVIYDSVKAYIKDNCSVFEIFDLFSYIFLLKKKTN